MSKEIVIGAQLAEILNEYNHALDETVNKEIEKITKETVAKLKAESPRGKTGKYARGWGSKRNADGSAVVYNKTHGSRTHLLENGHLIRNKYGTFGRTRAIPHIRPVEEWADDQFIKRIENQIKRGLV